MKSMWQKHRQFGKKLKQMPVLHLHKFSICFLFWFMPTLGKLRLASRMRLSDVTFVTLVSNRNITKQLRFFFINMLSRVRNCFHLSMYFRVITKCMFS